MASRLPTGRAGEGAELRLALLICAARSRTLSLEDLCTARDVLSGEADAGAGGARSLHVWIAGIDGFAECRMRDPVSSDPALSRVVPSVMDLERSQDTLAFTYGAYFFYRSSPDRGLLMPLGLLRRAWAEVETLIDACVFVAGVAAVAASMAACGATAKDTVDLFKVVELAKRQLAAGTGRDDASPLLRRIGQRLLSPLLHLSLWTAEQRAALASLGLELSVSDIAELREALRASADGLYDIGTLLSEWYGEKGARDGASLDAPLSAWHLGGPASQWAQPRPPPQDVQPKAASAPPRSKPAASAPQPVRATAGSATGADASSGAPDTEAVESSIDGAPNVPGLFARVPYPRIPAAVADAESASLLLAYSKDRRGVDESDRAKRVALRDIQTILERGLVGGALGVSCVALSVFGSSGNGFGAASADLDLSLKLTGIAGAAAGGGSGAGGAATGEDLADETGGAAPGEGGGEGEGPSPGDDGGSGGGGGMQAKAVMKHVVKALRRGGGRIAGLVPVFRARVPVVKFTHAPSSVAVDLVLGNDLAVHNTALLRTYALLDTRIPPLVWAVKTWARAHGVRGAEHHNLSSYALTLMAIAYVQHVGAIPSLQDPALRAARAGSAEAMARSAVRHGRWDVSFVDDPAFATAWWAAQRRGDGPASEGAAAVEQLTVADLFVGFLDFFAHRWDWVGGVVDIRGAALAEPRGVHAYKAPAPCRLSLRDPFELGHDLGRVLSEQQQVDLWWALHCCSRRAAEALREAAVPLGEAPTVAAERLRRALWDPVGNPPSAPRKNGSRKLPPAGFAAVLHAAAADCVPE